MLHNGNGNGVRKRQRLTGTAKRQRNGGNRALCQVSIIPLPFFRSRFAVPLAVAVSVHHCRCRCHCIYLYALACRRWWLAGQLRNNGKYRTRSYFNGRTVTAAFFAVYGCNGTEFSYVIFAEQRNFTMAELRNGNGRTATEWWKPGIKQLNRSAPFCR